MEYFILSGRKDLGRCLAFFFLLFLINQFQFSQSDNSTKSIRYSRLSFQNNLLTKSNSTYLQDTLKHSDISSQKKDSETFVMKKKPWIAVLCSLFPGGGQYYNESYWKVPILVGLSAYFGYEYYSEDKQFRSYRDQYATSQTDSNPGGDPYLKALRELYRNNRDDFTWYFLITYFINLVDAYVDAQLFDFNVREEKYSAFGKPNKTYNLNLHIKF